MSDERFDTLAGGEQQGEQLLARGELIGADTLAGGEQRRADMLMAGKQIGAELLIR